MNIISGDPTNQPTPTDIPEECQRLAIGSKNSVFEGSDLLAGLFLGSSLCLIVSIQIWYYKKRKLVSFITRSPIINIVGLGFLCADICINIVIFTGWGIGQSLQLQCDMGIVGTAFGFFGFLWSLILRMYRTFKVYNMY